MDTAWMPLLGPIKSCLPVAVLFLVVQGVSELLKALYAARKGAWPQQ
jgi:TRAP-type mannitol/chloroaromatic compound transport system permease small subunit